MEQPRKIRQTTSQTMMVTPAQARMLRDSAHFSRQRNLSPANIERLAAEMRRGTFTPGTQIYICVLPDGQQLIVNGNHTLEAIHASNLAQMLTLTWHPVADENAAGRIYAVFDIQKVRSWMDSLRATGADEDLPMARHVLSAIGVIDSLFAHRPVAVASRLDRINRLEEYKEPAELFAMIADGAPRQSAMLIRRAAVMAVALETLRYQPSLAAEFWERAVQDNGLTAGMPEKALLSWLRNTRGAGGMTAQREHCRAAALAWNAAYRNERRDYVKPNSMASFFLLGTPWDKGILAGRA